MSKYNRVLVALDFQGDNAEIIDKGADLAKANNAELFLIHVNEPLAIAYASDDGMTWGDQVVMLESNLRDEAAKRMAGTIRQLKLDPKNGIIRDGRPASEIHNAVDELGIDLIVLGTHGQSGLKLLLGSTASSVLHGVKCDVLAIRVGE